jgi:hypothetical protein
MDDLKHTELIERIARLEERVRALECMMKKLDNRLWAVIAGIILSILMQILLRYG